MDIQLLQSRLQRNKSQKKTVADLFGTNDRKLQVCCLLNWVPPISALEQAIIHHVVARRGLVDLRANKKEVARAEADREDGEGSAG